MFPQLAQEWQRQTEAEKGWNTFQLNDFQRLKAQFDVNWVVLEHPVAGMECPYANGSLQGLQHSVKKLTSRLAS
jgi:hypothetical protein